MDYVFGTELRLPQLGILRLANLLFQDLARGIPGQILYELYKLGNLVPGKPFLEVFLHFLSR